jgi:hypothetical protein
VAESSTFEHVAFPSVPGPQLALRSIPGR